MANRRRKLQQPAVSGIQSLETRQLLAGDVTVGLSAADARDLVITGDNSSNEIVVEEVAANRIRVSGQDGTTINGGTRSATFTVTDDVRIDMKGGSDRVTVRNLSQTSQSHSDVSVNLGTGNDTLVIDSVDAERYLKVMGGSGDDTIDVMESTARDMTIDGEYDEDSIHLLEVTVDNSVTVDGGEQADTLRVEDSVISNDLIVDGDTGGDDIDVRDVETGDNIVVDAGSGSDSVWVEYAHADDIFVYGRTGDDSVYFYRNQTLDHLYASLSSGNDYLWWLGNQAGRHYFNGGSDSDNWSSMDFWWSWSNFYNFE